ncbi:organic solute transporter Ostalpha-domain-containing protein [Lobosporangium transversale]|uniref:Organic solute transporter Ostalpha-domain-containing protein n=1 Tax=Lobosporangium transversale TaxID=64571 RepID=A0A1Y2G7D8_9FUNG|nr:organic solute transporter Ostalpha-domain-containing protein [Lobosporangium transversale]ORZ00002.1 organic solute transporter Ostalpha-domain-containing protein [Lobosporangium transversale]|eukprot:XP_021876043.1 organic solute transporter Ostalpha-domain-containing protein [Lobosporangium transversale]
MYLFYSHECPDYDSPENDPSGSTIWPDHNGLNGKRHLIGWALSGTCAFFATVISFHLLYRHAKNYNKPSEQRHIMRIVLMIPVYAIISFLSYRFYKEAVYFETIRDCYEAFVIYSFFILLLTYLGDDNETQRSKITGSDRRKLLYPLNCFYYNPLNENFLHYMKYGILQYVAIKPLCTLAAVILQYYGLYCETTYDFHFGMIYITIINFFSASVALYCLVLFYETISLEIQEHSPLMKFFCVKMVVFFCYWQTCVLSLLGALEVFKPENNWSILNVELGISSVLICIEMVVFSILHVYSFSYRPYVIPGVTTPITKSLWDGFNPVDMLREIVWACQDTVLMIQGKPMPVRDGHLSMKLQRAHTTRIRKRDRFFKSRKPAGGTQDSAVANQGSSSTHQISANVRDHREREQDEARARLLANADSRNYSSTSSVPV